MDPASGATQPEPSVSASLAPPLKQPGIWSGLGTVALYFLMQAGIGALVMALVAIAIGFRIGIEAGRQHVKPQTGVITHLLQHNPNIQVTVAVITITAAAVLMALLIRRFWPGQWSRPALPGFGFAAPTNALVYPVAVVLGLLVLFGGGWLTQLLAHGHPVNQDIAVMAQKVPTGMRVLLAVLVVAVAPWVEELVFRGVLLSGLARRMPVGWAILVSALIFGCVHLPDFKFAWYPVPALVLLGLLAGWLRVRTRSLWPSITLHATNNLVAVLAWFLVAHH